MHIMQKTICKINKAYHVIQNGLRYNDTGITVGSNFTNGLLMTRVLYIKLYVVCMAMFTQWQ